MGTSLRSASWRKPPAPGMWLLTSRYCCTLILTVKALRMKTDRSLCVILKDIWRCLVCIALQCVQVVCVYPLSLSQNSAVCLIHHQVLKPVSLKFTVATKSMFSRFTINESAAVRAVMLIYIFSFQAINLDHWHTPPSQIPESTLLVNLFALFILGGQIFQPTKHSLIQSDALFTTCVAVSGHILFPFIMTYYNQNIFFLTCNKRLTMHEVTNGGKEIREKLTKLN